MPSLDDYRAGCRCPGCRGFNAERIRNWRAGIRTGRLPRKGRLPSTLTRLRRDLGIVADATTTMRRL